MASEPDWGENIFLISKHNSHLALFFYDTNGGPQARIIGIHLAYSGWAFVHLLQELSDVN
jgi:hypothetical protein